MDAIAKKSEKSPTFVEEKGIYFSCSHCKRSIWLADIDTIVAMLGSGCLIALGILYWIYNGLFSFVSYSYSQSLGIGLLSSLLILIAALLCWGAILNIARALTLIKSHFLYPLSSASRRVYRTILVLLLGSLPLGIAALLGYINDTYLELEKGIILLLLPIIFVPFFFAKKLGIPFLSIFLASCFWLGILLTVTL